MKAITVWPEWACAIAHLGKDVENRGWSPPSWLVGARIAIHAGRHIGGRPGAVATEEGLTSVVRMAPRGAIGSILTMPPRFFRPDMSGIAIATSAIVATARLADVVTDSPSPWAVPDAYHWVLADLRTLREPVACRGAQGLWDVPDDVLAKVLAQEAA